MMPAKRRRIQLRPAIVLSVEYQHSRNTTRRMNLQRRLAGGKLGALAMRNVPPVGEALRHIVRAPTHPTYEQQQHRANRATA